MQTNSTNNSNHNVKVETKRLLLRPFTLDDLAAIPANKKNHVHSVVLGASLNIFS